MKTFKGKAIYNPAGKAGEYSYWACNFYIGCSNDCDYCYCKRGVLAHTWSNTPKLKKFFKDEYHALEIFEKELKVNLPELQKHGLFFSFTTDPMIKETIGLTMKATGIAIRNNIPCKILTKCADYHEWNMTIDLADGIAKSLISIGFTLTGHDELEPNASTNAERIETMRKLHKAGFKTWASIEPVIDLINSTSMIKQTEKYCDLYKIGLESGMKYNGVLLFKWVRLISRKFVNSKIYFKDSLLAQAEINRSDLPANCVGRDWNMFND